LPGRFTPIYPKRTRLCSRITHNAILMGNHEASRVADLVADSAEQCVPFQKAASYDAGRQ